MLSSTIVKIKSKVSSFVADKVNHVALIKWDPMMILADGIM